MCSRVAQFPCLIAGDTDDLSRRVHNHRPNWNLATRRGLSSLSDRPFHLTSEANHETQMHAMNGTLKALGHEGASRRNTP